MADPTIYDYWQVITRRKGTFLMVLVATVVSAAVFTYLAPEVYRSEAVITFRPPSSYAKIPGSDFEESDPRMAVQVVQTEIRLINSLEIARRTAEKLGLLSDPGNSAGAAKVSAHVRSLYKAEKLPDSNLIGISATGPDPESASVTAEAVIAAYREYNLEQKSKQAKKKVEDIAARRDEVEESLRTLERQKQDFVKRNPSAGLGAGLAAQLSELEIRRKQLLEKYTPNHPDVLGLDQRMDMLRGRLYDIPSQDAGLVRISRDLRMQEELYTTLNKQYEEAKLGLSSVVSFVGVVDPPAASDFPISPNISLNLVASAIVGFFLALAAVFGLENMDISVSTIEEIEQVLQLPVLGVIPGIPTRRRMDFWLTEVLRRERVSVHSFRSMLLSDRHSSLSAMEFYYTLRSNILKAIKHRRGASLVFCSSGKAEGKTLTAVNFALACVHSGMRTLLVDADIRRPWMHTVLGIRRSPGLSDILEGKADWREVVHDSSALAPGASFADLHRFPGIENLSALSCGGPHGDVTDLMDSADWAKINDELREEFDMVVFDAPPVLSFVDSLAVGRHCDGVVLVYMAGKIGRSALKRAKDLILAADANVLGVVLNSVRRTEMYSYYDYY